MEGGKVEAGRDAPKPTTFPLQKPHFFPLSDPAPPHLLLPEGLVLRVDHPDSPFDGQEPPELVVSHHGPGGPSSARAHRRSATAAAPRPDLTGGGGATAKPRPQHNAPAQKPRPLASSPAPPAPGSVCPRARGFCAPFPALISSKIPPKMVFLRGSALRQRDAGTH